MAQRRMFSKSITSSARFLRMPPTSRLLYYDLGMAADDEGVVEAFTVLRTTGAAEDDLRVLVSRGFIIVLNDDLVSYITDWSVNNQMRKDRFTPSVYGQLLVKLRDGNQLATFWQPDDNQLATQYSIGKDSSEKLREGQNEEVDKPLRASRFSPPSVEDVSSFCRENGYKNVDVERFVAYYEANGWKVGKNPMKSWCAAVRMWERREQTDKPGSIRTAERYTYNEEDSL